jgi:hypothetical protein
MKSWKTTACGAIGALGAYFIGIPDPEWLATVGKIMVGIGSVGVGFFARDNNVTSKDAGAEK